MPLCDYRIHSGYIKGKLFACYIRETAVIGQCRNRVNCSCTEVNYTVGKGCALNVGFVAERKGYGVPALFKFDYFCELGTAVCAAAGVSARSEFKRNKRGARSVNVEFNGVFACGKQYAFTPTE